MNDGYVLKDEKYHDWGIVKWISPTIIVDNIGPLSFSENRNHNVYGMNKSVEVWKLNLIIVILIIDLVIVFRIVKSLHANDTENEEEKPK